MLARKSALTLRKVATRNLVCLLGSQVNSRVALKKNSLIMNTENCRMNFSRSLFRNEQVEAEHVSDASEFIINSSKDTFQPLIESGEPIVIDFYAE